MLSIGALLLIGGPRATAASTENADAPYLLARVVENPDLGAGRRRQPLPELTPRVTIDPWAEPKQAAKPKKERLSDEALTAKIALWVSLKNEDSAAPFEEIAAFIDANPDWPYLRTLRIRAERAILPDTSKQMLLDWFSRHAPRTTDGSVAYADILLRLDQRDQARTVLRRAWVNYYMNSSTEKEFLARFGDFIDEPNHWARLDRLLWDRRVSTARRQIKRVNGDHRLLATARLNLMRMTGSADRSVKRVPSWLRDDPGLSYERLRWRRRKDKNVEARDLLLTPPDDPVRPLLWWKERQILARRALREDEAEIAYMLVRDHGLKGGAKRAEAEFMAGWIALRFVRDPQKAFRHFSQLHDEVSYPISKARASYWAGRAAEASGFDEIAEEWYRTATAHVTTFYGQLAADRLETPERPTIPNDPAIGAEAATAFDNDELVRAARLLISLQQDNPAAKPASGGKAGAPKDAADELAALDARQALVPILRHIVRRARTPEEWVLAGRLAREADRNEIAVYAAKRASRAGTVLGDLGYPTLAIPDDNPPDVALVHALVRQESEFDSRARSPVGARGLMQLMPRTARNVARKLNLRGHSTERLTSDPLHNVLLGSAYLDDMLERYNGSMIMALSAYNAGPHRVDRWIQDYGDPRGSLDSAIDWIESIPISETRNYVQRVLETVPIYRWKLRGGDVAVLRAEDVAGRRPIQEPSPR